MIFVTVGLHPRGFDRLVRVADEMASLIEELVVIQRGATRYAPFFARFFDFTDETQMQRWICEARVIVSHSGAGSILNVLQSGKPLVVVPRLKCFGEHIDDHQLELTEVLTQQGRAVAVMDPSAAVLQEAVTQATRLICTGCVGSGLQSALRAWLARQTAQPTRRWWGRFRPKQRGG